MLKGTTIELAVHASRSLSTQQTRQFVWGEGGESRSINSRHV